MEKFNNRNGLNPKFFSGISDGESCFYIGISKNNSRSIGWVVWLTFSIGVDRKDQALLESIESLLGVGGITKQGKNIIQYRVNSVKDLQVIIDHFEKYPLLSQKRADYLLFKQAFELLKRKEHLTVEGLKQIVAIKASSNLGLSEQLKEHFTEISPVLRPLVEKPKIIDPYWFAGFVEAEGCFLVYVHESSSHKIGYQARLRFSIGLHSRDELLLKSLVVFLGCGKYTKRSEFVGDFIVGDFTDINDKVIPFFKKYPLKGAKLKDFDDFCKVADIMKVNGHLTESGLEQIRLIKSGMNRGRTLSYDYLPLH